MSDEYMEEYSAFSEFIGQYGRSYATKDEHMGRFETFQANFRDIKAHNEKFEAGETSWSKAVNQFSDFTAEEFHERYLSAKLDRPVLPANKDHTVKGRPHIVGAARVPEYVNWKEAGKVSDSIDQGGCGACWAFTTATTLESLNAIQNNLTEVPRYSVQYLLDCDDGNFGCDGGWMADSYDFTKDSGIIAWEDYPRGYQGRKTRCADPGSKVARFHNTQGHEEDMVSNDRMKELIAQNPVGVAIYSNFGCLGNYNSGIISDADCNCSNPDKNDVNHAVSVVGYGKAESGKCSEYWLVKNSWGPYWGDHGLFKLCADRAGRTSEYGTCQINSYVQWPTL